MGDLERRDDGQRQESEHLERRRKVTPSARAASLIARLAEHLGERTIGETATGSGSSARICCTSATTMPPPRSRSLRRPAPSHRRPRRRRRRCAHRVRASPERPALHAEAAHEPEADRPLRHELEHSDLRDVACWIRDRAAVLDGRASTRSSVRICPGTSPITHALPPRHGTKSLPRLPGSGTPCAAPSRAPPCAICRRRVVLSSARAPGRTT